MSHPARSGCQRLYTIHSGRLRGIRPVSFLLLCGVVASSLGCGEEVTAPQSDASDTRPTMAGGAAGTLRFAMVSAGGGINPGDGERASHTCGVTEDKRAYCWGENSEGQLGNGTTISSSRPVLVAGGLQFVQVSAGARFTCGITTTNLAYCWGSNRNGQLGTGSFQGSSTPVPVSGGRRFRMVRAGYDHTCAVTPFDVGFCWGMNRFGELGANSTTAKSQVPIRVAGGLQWNRIVAGGHYSCGVTTGQRAYCWGYNGNGRLGDGSFASQRRPVPVAGGLRFRLVVAGGGGFDDLQFESPTDAHTCGVTPENRGYCWGRVGGNTNNTPTLVPGTRRWQQLIAGYTHRCGITLAQVALCWGENGSGQLGNGTTTSSDTPQRVVGGLEFQAVTLGTAGSHSCGLTTEGRVYCWGLNDSGQLGDGTNTNRSRPVEVAAP